MHVRIAMLACVLGLLLGGCPAQDQGEQRLQVNDNLRSKCYMFDDEGIQRLIYAIDDARQEGAAKSEVLAAAFYGCDSEECGDCAIAIVDQVYGD